MKGKYVIGEKHGIWKAFNNIGEVIEVLKFYRGELVSINGVKVTKVELIINRTRFLKIRAQL